MRTSFNIQAQKQAENMAVSSAELFINDAAM
jgi:hypothetical protein